MRSEQISVILDGRDLFILQHRVLSFVKGKVSKKKENPHLEVSKRLWSASVTSLFGVDFFLGAVWIFLGYLDFFGSVLVSSSFF